MCASVCVCVCAGYTQSFLNFEREKILQLSVHKTCHMCSHQGTNSSRRSFEKGSCSITPLICCPENSFCVLAGIFSIN